MKKTQILDALRNIKKQIISFLSIVVIALLGVTMFLGIDYAAAAIRKNGSEFYNSRNFRDVEAISTLLFSEEDLEGIRSMEGVRDVEGVFSTSAKVSSGDMRKDATIVSLTERINLPVLLEGRLPEYADECAVERSLAEQMGWKTGDTVSLLNAKGERAEYLRDAMFRITGLVVHPDHICGSVPDTLYIMVTHDAFDMDAIDHCCMRAEILLDRAENAARFDPSYRKTVNLTLQGIEEFGATRFSIQEAKIKTHAQKQIDENRGKLEEAKTELTAARAELDDGKKALEAGEASARSGENLLKETQEKLEQAKKILEEGALKLNVSREQLDRIKEQLEGAAAELDVGREELERGKQELIDGWKKIEDGKEKIRDKIRSSIEQAIGQDTDGIIDWVSRQTLNPDSSAYSASVFRIAGDYKIDLNRSLAENVTEIISASDIPDSLLRNAFETLGGEGEYDPDAARAMIAERVVSAAGGYEDEYGKLADACRRWDRGHREYLEGLAKYKDSLKKYEEGLKQYLDGEDTYAAGLQEYEDGLREYRDGEQQYDQGVEELEKAREIIETNRQRLQTGEQEYALGLEQYETGEAKLAEAVERLETLGPCKWILLDTYGNSSFVQLGSSGENLKSLEMTFSMLFVLVGALVIYATVSKMIDEQRTLVGTTKALGFYKREIFAKYLLFGVSATVFGAILGMLLARLWVERFILNGYQIYYNVDIRKPTVVAAPTIIVAAAGILLTLGAVWFACARLLKTPAIRLMQQAVPEGRRKSAKTRKPVLSLYSRLILLNMKTDFKRVLVTIVSVAGCCALVVIGFTLRRAVNGAVLHQFNNVVQYDGMVLFDSGANENAAETIGKILDKANIEAYPITHSYVSVRIRDLEIQELYCGDLGQIASMHRMDDPKTDRPLPLSDEGIYIPKRFSEVYRLKPGDSFEITMNGTETAQVAVAGIFNNYMNRTVIMSSGCYRTLFAKDSEPNAFLVRLNGTTEDALFDLLHNVEGYEQYRSSDGFRSLFKAATAVMDAVVLLFIFMAAVMAGVVLMNLTNIYVMQKKRELTIMRINGFTVGETISYVARETVVTTVLGILLGILLGSAIGYRIVRALEQPFVQFDRSVSVVAWLIGAAITILFTAVINVIVLRKVKDLKLTDVA